MMTGEQRVRAALDFRNPDCVPLYDQYWGGFVAAWRARQGLPPRSDLPLDDIAYHDADIQSFYHVDLYKLIPNEDPWPGRAEVREVQGTYVIRRDGWGRLVRCQPTSPYGEPLAVALERKGDLDALAFEPATGEARYASMLALRDRARGMPHRPYLFLKVGGPYLRSSFLRGEARWFMDIAEDAPFAAAVARRITDHLIAVGIEALRRSELAATSIWIFDDVASNNGLLISPRCYERLFLPEIRRMVSAFKAAGAAHVGFHSDGDVRAVLPGLVDAGISILNPVEPRANMDVVQLRQRYGRKLTFVGGLCNTLILPTGSPDEVRRHVEHVLSAEDGGGLIIGSHSISTDIPLERYDLLMEILHEHGRLRSGSLKGGDARL